MEASCQQRQRSRDNAARFVAAIEILGARCLCVFLTVNSARQSRDNAVAQTCCIEFGRAATLPVSAPYVTATIISAFTLAPSGNVAIPTADRACRPASPSTSISSCEALLIITCGSGKSGSLLTKPARLTTTLAGVLRIGVTEAAPRCRTERGCALPAALYCARVTCDGCSATGAYCAVCSAR